LPSPPRWSPALAAAAPLRRLYALQIVESFCDPSGSGSAADPLAGKLGELRGSAAARPRAASSASGGSAAAAASPSLDAADILPPTAIASLAETGALPAALPAFEPLVLPEPLALPAPASEPRSLAGIDGAYLLTLPRSLDVRMTPQLARAYEEAAGCGSGRAAGDAAAALFHLAGGGVVTGGGGSGRGDDSGSDAKPDTGESIGTTDLYEVARNDANDQGRFHPLT
jgi:hypothetical protein